MTVTPTMSVEESLAAPSANPHHRPQLLVVYLGTSAHHDALRRDRPVPSDDGRQR